MLITDIFLMLVSILWLNKWNSTSKRKSVLNYLRVKGIMPAIHCQMVQENSIFLYLQRQNNKGNVSKCWQLVMLDEVHYCCNFSVYLKLLKKNLPGSVIAGSWAMNIFKFTRWCQIIFNVVVLIKLIFLSILTGMKLWF